MEQASAAVGGRFLRWQGILLEFSLLAADSFHPAVRPQVQRNQEPPGAFIEDHLDPLGVMIVIQEHDLLSDQPQRRFVELAVQTHRTVLVDFSSHRSTEVVQEILGRRTQQGQVIQIPSQRALTGRGVLSFLVLLFHPCFEFLVQDLQSELLGQQGQNLHPDGFHDSLNFALAFRGIGCGVQQGDTQAGAGILEPMAAKGSPVIHEQPSRKPSLLQGLNEAIPEGIDVFPQVELGVRNQSGVIVDNGKQVGLS